MSENAQQRPDPEALAKICADKVQPLDKVFCSLEGKAAIVSGGASGLGYQVVNRLCQAGAKVVIADIREDRGERAIREFMAKGYDVAFCKTDVRSVKDCYALVEFTEKTYTTPDILVTCAAEWSCYSYLDLPEEVYDRVLDTDLKGSYFLGQAAARAMVRDKVKGKIVFISSAAHMGEGPVGIGMNSYYPAAKAGVVALVIYALCTPMSDFMCGETVNVNGGAMMIMQEKPFSFTVEGCLPGPKKAE